MLSTLMTFPNVSSFISALHIQKASRADGLCARFIRASPCMARLVTVSFD